MEEEKSIAEEMGELIEAIEVLEALNRWGRQKVEEERKKQGCLLVGVHKYTENV